MTTSYEQCVLSYCNHNIEACNQASLLEAFHSGQHSPVLHHLVAFNPPHDHFLFLFNVCCVFFLSGGWVGVEFETYHYPFRSLSRCLGQARTFLRRRAARWRRGACHSLCRNGHEARKSQDFGAVGCRGPPVPFYPFLWGGFPYRTSILTSLLEDLDAE